MPYDFSKITLLLAEDLPAVQNLTMAVLKEFGFMHILAAQDGDSAWRLFNENKVDIVLTDWLMQPADGLSLIRRLRDETISPDPFVPVILMTGLSTKEKVEEARDCGITEFLVKPFTARDLYSRFVQVIERPRPFVRHDQYFGPDRRRKRNVPFKGQDRREQNDS